MKRKVKNELNMDRIAIESMIAQIEDNLYDNAHRMVKEYQEALRREIKSWTRMLDMLPEGV